MEAIPVESFRFYVVTRCQLDKSAAEIHSELTKVWSDEAPSLRTIYRWMKDFSDGSRTSFGDELRSGRPRSTRTEELTDSVDLLVRDDPRLSSREIADAVNSNHATVLRVLNEDLHLRHVCSVWVPHQLTEQQRQLRVNCARNLQRTLTGMGEEKYNRYAVQDETWVNWDASRTKSENRTWLPTNAPRQQVTRPSLTPRKTLLMVAFTANGRFSVTALPYGVTCDATKMVEFLQRTGDLWRTLRSNPIRLKDLEFQMDNARPHTAREVRDFLDRRLVSTIPQSPYSPDLNLCDRFLFLWMKNELRHRSFNSTEEVEAAALQSLRSIDRNAMCAQVDKLLEHCQLVIDSQGHYVT